MHLKEQNSIFSILSYFIHMYRNLPFLERNFKKISDFLYFWYRQLLLAYKKPYTSRSDMVWLFNLQGECAKNPIGFGGEMNRLVYYILLMQFRILEYHLIFWYSFSILK